MLRKTHKIRASGDVGDRPPSTLGPRHVQHYAVALIENAYLAAEAAPIPPLFDEFEHLVFFRRGRPDLAPPGFVYVDVAGGARTWPSTISLNFRYSRLDSAIHNTGSRCEIAYVYCLVVSDIGNLHHIRSPFLTGDNRRGRAARSRRAAP